MATVLNTLYPPSVNSYLPAFPYDETAKILFSLSSFNSISEIEFIHVSVVDQKTNENILVRKGENGSGVPIPVLISQVWPMADGGEEPVDKNNLENCLLYDKKTGMFKVEIPLENIKTDYWNVGQYYKVQLRFDSTPSSVYIDTSTNTENQNQIPKFLLNTITINTANGEITTTKNPSFDISKLNSHLSDHLGYFSEWSQVCLIRPILKPKIVLNGFSEGQKSQEDFEGFSAESIPQFSLGNLWVTGRMNLTTAKNDPHRDSRLNLETETLNSYQISVFKENKLLLQEKKVFTANNLANSSINEINSLVSLENISKNEIDDNSTYFLKIDAFTSSGHKIQNSFFVFKLLSEEDNFRMVRNIEIDQENGLLQMSAAVQIPVGEGAGDGNYKLTVKRSSDRSNFQDWEVIKIFDISPSKLYQSEGKNYFVFCQKNALSLKKLQGNDFPDFSAMLQNEENANKIGSILIDNTIGSLNWYKYSFQLESYEGLSYKRQETETIFSEFEHAILSRGKKQLGLKFDCAISNVKPVTNRMKTDTLGGKYPKFTENAILGYKQMSISGRISSQADENELFLSKDILSSEAYNDYYDTKDGTECFKRGNWLEYQDWLWEREFREEAVKWLNDGEPKLLRTSTEGNMCVMLTDINLTPDKVLGRRLYNFSATVYEVGDGYSLKSLDQLGIYEIEDETAINYEELMASLSGESLEEDSSYFVYNKLGQLSDFCYEKYPWFNAEAEGQNVNVISFLEEKLLQSFQGTSSTVPTNNVWLKNVRVQFRNPPHALTSALELKDEDTDKLVYTGYRIDAKFSNGETTSILVGKDGFYQFPKDLILSELKFPHMNIKIEDSDGEQKLNTDIVDLDFNLVYNATTRKELIVSRTMVIKNLIGQDSRNYQPGESARKNLHLKHYFVDAEATYTQDLGYWKGISIETIPYTVVKILYYDKINEMPEAEGQSFIVGQSGFFNLFEDYYVYDIVFRGRKMFKATNEYAPREHEYIVGGESVPSNPKHQYVYGKDKDYWICWNGKFYPFDEEEEIAEIPVDAILNYKGSIVRRYRSQ